MPKLQLEDIMEEDRQQLLQQAYLLAQPEVPFGGEYHKMELDSKIYCWFDHSLFTSSGAIWDA